MRYPFETVEPAWQDRWGTDPALKTNFSALEQKLYTLVMFIYPSGAKLHCGHWYNYAPTDSYARFKRLRGYSVFEPMGYDAFGLPAENFAIKTGIHPYDSTMKNIEDIRTQLKRIGCMYDWDAEMMTCHPDYYKWNQWLFLQLFSKGLAYRKNAPVNWCTSCKTVLAREQVETDGTCERCGSQVIQKQLTQWFFKITDYVEELLSGLDTINWPEKTKLMQRNWIGKSEGAEIYFPIEGTDETMTVFTTRPDTLFGVTYVVIAPEHPLVDKITTPEYRDAVSAYRDESGKLNEIERSSTTKEKSGVPTGAFAINPVNGQRVPVWTGDYVLATYGTGCVMAVPGHDERDFAFAKKFQLPIVKVILQPGTEPEAELTEAYTEPGIMINSGEYNGMDSETFKKVIARKLADAGTGKGTINYRLRDWLISRQRYWGTPIPIIHCTTCGEVPVPFEQLPVELPYDVKFDPTGQSPLLSNESFMNVACPKCGTEAKRDPDTMDTFVDSSWYYLRFLDPHIKDAPFNVERAKQWAPVDMYVGGAEHATMHLLYSRFIHKFLRDLGLVNCDEPFQTLRHQGTITNQGAKMSKSKGNIVNPDEYIAQYGSDVFRLYLMFMGPYEAGGDWSDEGISGPHRFVNRFYDLITAEKDIFVSTRMPASFAIDSLSEAEAIVYKKINQSLVKVTAEMEKLGFNTAIAALMETLNECSKNFRDCRSEVKAYCLERFTVMLAPLAPHLAEECRSILGATDSVFAFPKWYEADPAALVETTVQIAVQVSGKLRGTLICATDATQDEVYAAANADEKIRKHYAGKEIVKVIFVKNKILNIVAR